jgi:hypothetical protein
VFALSFICLALAWTHTSVALEEIPVEFRFIDAASKRDILEPIELNLDWRYGTERGEMSIIAPPWSIGRSVLSFPVITRRSAILPGLYQVRRVVFRAQLTVSANGHEPFRGDLQNVTQYPTLYHEGHVAAVIVPLSKLARSESGPSLNSPVE